MNLYTPAEIQLGWMAVVKALTSEHERYELYIKAASRANEDYRTARENAYVNCEEKSATGRLEYINTTTGRKRALFEESEAKRDGCLERIRSLREELRGWNGLMFLVRSEMELTRG